MARAKNQDSVFAGNVGKSSSLFAIFDGHGKYGHDVSQLLAEKISGSLAATVKAAEAAGDGLQVSTVQTLLETSLQIVAYLDRRSLPTKTLVRMLPRPQLELRDALSLATGELETLSSRTAMDSVGLDGVGGSE
eukprot:499113-Rhodomonas_salina.1